VALHGQIVLGIDTHKHTHVGVILDGLGRVSGALQFPATEAGAQRLLAWNQENGGATIAGVEGTGSYGYPLTRALQLAGVTVLEVNRPDRANRDAAARTTPSTPKPPPAQCCPDKQTQFRRTARAPWTRCAR
jgi:transposase